MARLLAATALLLTSAQDISSSVHSRLSSIIAQHPCVRLLQTGGDAGCSSADPGAAGAVASFSTQAQLSSFLQTHDAKVTQVLLLPPNLMTASNLDAIGAKSWVSGVVALPGPIPAGGFSPTSSTPGAGPAARAWNPAGLGLLSQRYNIPIISVDDAAASDLLARAAQNAEGTLTDGPRSPVSASTAKHSIFNYFPMGPPGLDTPTCISQGSCLPLGGQSSWATLGPLDAAVSSAVAARPLVLATAPIDATALFHDLAVGADAAASAAVALLAAADALGREPTSFSLPLQPAFAQFQAEQQWGRLGSRRWLSEASSFNCQAPIPPSQAGASRGFCAFPTRGDLTFQNLSATPLAAVISVDQVGLPGTTGFVVHPGQGVLPGGSGPASNPVLAVLQALSAGLPLPIAASTVPGAVLPPTSADSWLELGWPGPVRPAAWYGGLSAQDTAAPSLARTLGLKASPTAGYATAVLAGYDQAYRNPYYCSRFDNASNVDPAVVTAAATALAKAMYALALNVSDPVAAAAAVPASVAANGTLVSSWLDCLTRNAACSTFAALFNTDVKSMEQYVPSGTVPGLYPSIYNTGYATAGGQPASGTGSNADGFVVLPSLVEAAVRNQLALSTAGNAQRNATAVCSLPPPASVSLARSGPAAGDAAATDGSAQTEGTPGTSLRARRLDLALRNGELAATQLGDAPCLPPYECIADACVLSSAHYHDAYSLAVDPVAGSPGAFTFNATTAAAVATGPRPDATGDNVWAEPYWSAGIGASVFLKESESVEVGMGVFGLLLTAASVGAAWAFNKHMAKKWGGKGE